MRPIPRGFPGIRNQRRNFPQAIQHASSRSKGSAMAGRSRWLNSKWCRSSRSAGPASIAEAAATGLALVIHELATNSMKYGALSAADGMLDLSSDTDGDDIVLTWLERGGPAVTARKRSKASVAKLCGAASLANLAAKFIMSGLKMD